MKSIRSTLFFISLSVILLMLGSTYFTTFISVKLSHQNISEIFIGVVHMAYSIGFVVGTIKTDFFIQRFRYTKSYMVLTLLFAFSTINCLFFSSIYSWMLFRFVCGFCLAALYVILESFYLLISPNEKRGQVLAIYMIALYLSQSASQIFHDILPIDSSYTFIILSGFLILSCLPMFFVDDSNLPKEQIRLFQAFKNLEISKLGLHASFASGVVLTGLYSFLPILAQKLELKVSISMILLILGGLIFQWPIGYLSDKMDRKKLLFGLCWALIAPCMLPIFYPLSTFASYLLITLIGGLSFALYPLAMTLVCENKPKEELTALTGILVLVFSFGMIFGPMLPPIMNHLKDPYGVYLQLIIFSFFLIGHSLFESKKITSTTSTND